MICEITADKGAVCAEILASLPHWFGIPEFNAAYVRAVEGLPMFASIEGGRIHGFIALKRNTPHAFEIYVLGVRPELHRAGVGRGLLADAEEWVRRTGVRILTVKTLSPRRPDPGYERTRAFYEAMGFVPIEEFETLWNPENPALLLLKILE